MSQQGCAVNFMSCPFQRNHKKAIYFRFGIIRGLTFEAFHFLYILWPFAKKIPKCFSLLPSFTTGRRKNPNDRLPMCLGHFQFCGLFVLREQKRRWYMISVPSHYIRHFRKQRNIICFPVKPTKYVYYCLTEPVPPGSGTCSWYSECLSLVIVLSIL